MKTIVLDDDPTGTQSASGVTVLLEWDVRELERALRASDSVYLQTNSRALDEDAAVALARRIRAEGEEAGRRIGATVRFVLRGDSTLRGHVFAETAVFLDDAVMLFVPAFPDGGRTTRDGMHLVRIGGVDVPAASTEYADDPVFPFRDSLLVDYVRRGSGRAAVSVDLASVRDGALAAVLLSAEPGTVVVPDAVEQCDIDGIAAAVRRVERSGRHVVVRCAAPLAAALAGVTSTGLLPMPIVPDGARVLVAVGSHTAGATAQLAPLAVAGVPFVEIEASAALVDAEVAGRVAASSARHGLDAPGVTGIATSRVRRADHGTLGHGETVMRALCGAVRRLVPDSDVVIAKGGITSNEVARTGIGARSAVVRGQILPGVSVWDLVDRSGRPLVYVVVPGNVGGPDTLTRALAACGHELDLPG